jgi:hypothetical protein
MKLHPSTEVYQGRVNFYLVEERHGEKRSFGKPVTMETPEMEGLLMEPTFSLPLDEAQELFEKLWAQGFRSKHDRGNSEALDAARREHIGDLRKAAKLS